MAERKNLVTPPPLNAAMIDDSGRVSKAWAPWFRDLYARTADKKSNSIDENGKRIVSNKEEADISFDFVSATLSEIAFVIADHMAQETAHGSNGNVIGANDLATEAVSGLVKKLSLVADAADSTVEISLADLLDAPLSYDPPSQQLLIDLCNAQKAAINQLKTDLNNVNSVLKNVLVSAKNAGLMSE